MEKIKLNLRGFKTEDSEDLRYILGELDKVVHKLSWEEEPIKKVLITISFDIRRELSKRQISKQVLVKFTAEWSGYTSKQKRDCAIEYRKIDRTVWNKMPKYFSHNFSDNTYNGWRAEVVNKNNGDSRNTYGSQVDKFLENLIDKVKQVK